MVEPSLRIPSIRFGGFQSDENDHADIGSGLGITKVPDPPANYNRTDCVLYLVVADFNFSMPQKRAKVRPLVGRIDNCFFSLPAGLNMVCSQAYSSTMGLEGNWRCSWRSASSRFSSYCSASKNQLQYSIPFAASTSAYFFTMLSVTTEAEA